MPVFFTENASLANDSGWVPLLLCIMHETTSPNSRWKPYLSLVPKYTELDLPMFWSKCVIWHLLIFN